MLSDGRILILCNQLGVKVRTGAGAIKLSRAIEAEVRKQDTALIRQLVEALGNSSAMVFQNTDAAHLRGDAIKAGRARLQGEQ